MFNAENAAKFVNQATKSAGWNAVHDGENQGTVMAEWLLTQPYTGPAKAYDSVDEWVHYPNGYLKVRTRKETGKYGARFVIPGQVFSNPEKLQALIGEVVADFINNYESCLITNNQYHQGQISGKWVA